ncbi:hypothetical protein ACU686_45010 [Yinghuangia aomiensis]
MSVFAAGGSVGLLLAPVLATPALVAWGSARRRAVVHSGRAVLVAYVLYRNRHRQQLLAAKASATRTGADRWPPFLVLTAIEVVRSVTCLSSESVRSSSCTGSSICMRRMRWAGPRWRCSWAAVCWARCWAGGSRTGSGWCVPSSSAGCW